MGVAVVQHGILEPQWDEVGALGKGGIRLVWRLSWVSNEGRQGATHRRSPSWSSVPMWDWKDGSVAAVVIGAWLQTGIGRLRKYDKDNRSQVSHCQRISSTKREKTRMGHMITEFETLL